MAARDATPSVLAGLLADPRIRALRTGGDGVAAARSAAMAEAKGQLFAYLDSDNVWRPEFLEIAASYLLERNLDLVYAALGNQRRLALALRRRRLRLYRPQPPQLHRHQRRPSSQAPLRHARRLRCRRLKRMSDWDLIWRYAKDSRVAYAPFIGCVYDDRLTRTDRITVSEPVGWTYVVLGKHHLDWDRLQSDLAARDDNLVSIVIPVHGQPELTAACLSSLFEIEAGCRFELVLVDNGSDAATAALLDRCVAVASECPAGAQLGESELRPRLQSRLCRDPRRHRGVPEQRHARPARMAACAGDATRRPGDWRGPAQAALSRTAPFKLLALSSVNRGHIPYELYRGLPGDAPHLNSPHTLAMISGACLAIRAGDFAALHGFDPIFINGQEDNDLCLRLKPEPGQDLPGGARFRRHPSRRRNARPRPLHLQQSPHVRGTLEGSSGAERRRDLQTRWLSCAPLRPGRSGVGTGRTGLVPSRPRTCGRRRRCRARRCPGSRSPHPSFAIKIACPSEAVREEWGDYHFARSLAQALLRLGCRTRIDYLRSWNEPDNECEIDLVLRGLERFIPKDGRPSIMWVISHPDLVEREEIAAYSRVFVASDRLARQWSGEFGTRVEPLLQCTDRGLFFPDPSDSARSRDILFVGNSRNVFRPAVHAAIEAGLAPTVYGTRWETLIDARYIKAPVIPNAMVGELYRKAGVVLNDHWPDMVRSGILSNRVFDVLACAAPIVSDEISDLPAGFSDFVTSFGPDRPIGAAIAQAMSEGADRRAARRAFAEIVRRDHSFDCRAAIILDCARALLGKRGQPPVSPA